MIYQIFEEDVRRMVPDMILKQFRHLLPHIPESYRERFLALIRRGCDMTFTILTIATTANIRHKVVTEFVHQRMQDNMSEIMD